MFAPKNPTFGSQFKVMVARRFRQFVREPKNWSLLATPFVTATFGFLIVYKIQLEFPDAQKKSEVF